MLEIRPHHLLCLATFRGKGYSEEFVANMQSVYLRLARGERARLVLGPDAICRACPEQACQAHLRDERLLALTGWQADETFQSTERIQSLMPAFPDWLAAVCQGCPWLEFCQSIEPGFPLTPGPSSQGRGAV